MAYLIQPSRRRIRQPQGPTKLVSKFERGNGGGAWNPSNGFLIPGLGSVSQTQTSPVYTGSRFVNINDTIALRSYADHGGNDDDRFLWPVSIPTAKAGPYTSIMYFIAKNNGNTYSTLALSTGQDMAVFENGNFQSGYTGYNGYNTMYTGGLVVGSVFDRLIALVVSTKSGSPIVIACDGYSYDYNSGFDYYVGQGTLGSLSTPQIGASEFSNYYYFNGYIALWANFPDVYISKEEAIELSINPWEIYARDPRRVYFDLAKAQEIRDKNAEIAAPKKPIVRISAQKLCTSQPIGAVKPKLNYDPIVLFNAASGTTDCVTGYTAAGKVTEFNTTHGIANENTAGAFYYGGKQYYRAHNRSAFTAFVVAYRLGSSSGDFLAYTNGGYGWRMRIEDYEWNQAAVKFLANWSGNGATVYTPQAMAWLRNSCAVIGISVDCVTRAYSFYMNGKPIGSGTLVYEVDPVQDTNANNSLVWVAYNTGIKVISTGLLYGTHHDLASLTSNPWQVFASNTPIYTSLSQANGTMRPTIKI